MLSLFINAIPFMVMFLIAGFILACILTFIIRYTQYTVCYWLGFTALNFPSWYAGVVKKQYPEKDGA